MSLLQGHEPAERANWNTLLPVIHIYIGAYTKIFASKIFLVGGRSSKNAKFLRLENLALYGITPHKELCRMFRREGWPSFR